MQAMSRFGGRDAPGGPVEQPHAEPGLELTDGLGKGGSRQSQLIGRAGEASRSTTATKAFSSANSAPRIVHSNLNRLIQ